MTVTTQYNQHRQIAYPGYTAAQPGMLFDMPPAYPDCNEVTSHDDYHAQYQQLLMQQQYQQQQFQQQYHQRMQMQMQAQQQRQCQASPYMQRIEELPATSSSSSSSRSIVVDVPLPVVIPQTNGQFMRTYMSPFMRAYPPQLQQHRISQSAFLTFIDGLNEAFMSSPALQVVQLAGTVAGFAPSVIAQAVGNGVSLAAGLGSAANSYARTRAFIKKSNVELFAPRGLHVKIVSTNDMMKAIGVNEAQLRLPPLPEFTEQGWDPSSPATDPRQRRMHALSGRVAELNTNVPPMQMPDSLLRKMGAWQAKRQDNKERKEHAKQCKKEAKKGAAKQQQKFAEREQKANQRIRWIVIVPVADKNAAAQTADEEVDVGLDDK